MTIHGLKLELKRLRYPENCAKCINSLPKAITFDPTINISFSLVFWKLDIHIFLRTLRSTQLEFGKAFKYASKAEPEKEPRLLMSTLDPAATKGL